MVGIDVFFGRRMCRGYDLAAAVIGDGDGPQTFSITGGWFGRRFAYEVLIAVTSCVDIRRCKHCSGLSVRDEPKAFHGPFVERDRLKIFWESQRLISQSVQADRPVPSNTSTIPSTESEIKANPNPNPQAPRNITTGKARGSSSEDFKPTNAGSRTRAGENRNKPSPATFTCQIHHTKRSKKKRRPVSRRESSNPSLHSPTSCRQPACRKDRRA